MKKRRKRIAKVLCLIVGVFILVSFGKEKEMWGAEEGDYSFTIREGVYCSYECEYKETADGVEIVRLKANEYEDVSAWVSLWDEINDLYYDTFGIDEGLFNLELPKEIAGRPVISIGDNAFAGCWYLKRIDIPSGVTSIGDGAFAYCENLKKIEIPSGVTRIGDGTFKGCWNIKKITLPSGVTSIGDSAFFGCEKLKRIEIPSGVTNIGESAFSGCLKLEKIKLPDSLERIEDHAFNGCENLTEIVVPDGVLSIGEDAFVDANMHVHKYEDGAMSRKERCYTVEREGKGLKCLECGQEANHSFANGVVIGGSKLVAPRIIEGTCDVCGAVGRWNDWSYAWLTGIVAVVLLGFVVAIINYMHRMKRNYIGKDANKR